MDAGIVAGSISVPPSPQAAKARTASKTTGMRFFTEPPVRVSAELRPNGRKNGQLKGSLPGAADQDRESG